MNEVVSIRAVEPEDLEYLYHWENNREVWTVSNTLVPFSRFQLRQYIESNPSDIFAHHQLRMMIDCEESVTSEKCTIGTIDLFDFDPLNQRAGIGILIASSENRRQGYACKAIQLMVEYAKSVIRLHQLYCNISASNTASLRLFEKAGFQISGSKKDWLKTDNGWEDEYILQYFI